MPIDNTFHRARTGFGRRPSFHTLAGGNRSPFSSQLFLRLLLLLVPFLSTQAFATTLLYKSFDDLVKESDGIVSGRVAGIESYYSPEHAIYTFVTLDQLEVLGGTYPSQTLTLRFKGGQVDNNITRIAGSPEFALNDQVVLFVQGNGQYMVPVVGWTQGVFRVTRDAATGHDVIYDHEGNKVFGIRGGEVVKERTAQPAAHILSPYRSTSSNSDNKSHGGTADYAPQTAPAPAAAQTAAQNLPVMTAQAFIATIRRSASAKKFQNEMKSIAVKDFSRPTSSSTDVSVGEKLPAVEVPRIQSPAKPERKQAPQPQDRM